MNHPMRLAYLVFGARKPAEWANFLDRMLGLPAPVTNTDGSRGWRIDGAQQRLVVAEDASDDLLALGLELTDDAALDALVRRLESQGLAVAPGTAAECEARRVFRLVRLQDAVLRGLFRGPHPPLRVGCHGGQGDLELA